MIGRLNPFLVAIVAASGSFFAVDAQLSADLGSPAMAGSSSGSGSDWTVTGAGKDIWSRDDEGHYLYWPRAVGNVTVTCKINDFSPYTYHWMKGGIMFRKCLESNCANASILKYNSGLTHQRREGDGESSYSKSTSYPKRPWLRLVKSGSTVTSYVKQDGDFDWMKIYSHEIPALGDGDFYVGLAVSSHEEDQSTTLSVSDFEISDTIYELPDHDLVEIGDVTGDVLYYQEVKEDLFRITGEGAGIGGTSDSFVFRPADHTGDIVATMYLEKLERENSNTKGGLMIRASQEPGAPHVSLLVQSEVGITMFSRAAANADTVSLNVGVWEERIELKMVKVGGTVTCYYRPTGGAAAWFEVGSVTVPALDAGINPFHVGQAMASADLDRRVVFDASAPDVQVYVA